MAKSIPGQLSMFSLWTLEASPSATSSPGSAAGAMPCVLPNGQTTGRFGRGVARASRFRLQAGEPGWTTQGTYGPTFIASLPLTGPLSLWENRLRDRLATVGSTECALIWKEKITPAGQSIFRLSPSMPRTFANASTGSQWTWPTPRTTDKTGGRILTPDGKRTNAAGTLEYQANISDLVHLYATWPTPTSVNRVRDEETLAKCAAFRLRNANQKTVPLYLGEVAQNTVRSGPTTSGSPDQTANRGALAPTFPCWLMGYPIIWDECAPKDMPKKSKR